MRLYIDLSPTEEANIHGWVNKGLADPAFAANPWRLVLEERTRARFDQIAEQFVAVAPPAPPPPPVLPPGTKVDTLELVVVPDKRVLFAASAEYVTAIPFIVPPGPYGVTSMFSGTAAEYEWGGMSFAHAALSRTAGDLTGASGGMSSLQVWRDAQVDGAGLWYYNIQLVPGSQDRGSGFSWTAPR